MHSFVFFYGLFIDAASFIYSSEIYPTNIRSEGVALATFTYFSACITFVMPGATAIASIGYKYFISKLPHNHFLHSVPMFGIAVCLCDSC